MIVLEVATLTKSETLPSLYASHRSIMKKLTALFIYYFLKLKEHLLSQREKIDSVLSASNLDIVFNSRLTWSNRMIGRFYSMLQTLCHRFDPFAN